MHQIILLIGSNIEPQKNIPAALKMLEEVHPFKRCSRIWKTKAFGSEGPDFLNIAVQADTSLSMTEYKLQVIKKIETALKRERFSNKNAPRTIDIDIIVFDDKIIDRGIWNKFFITVPLADLLPEWKNPDSGKSLRDHAQEMLDQGLASFYADCLKS